MIEEEADWDDRTVIVRHTRFGHGSLGNLSDNGTSTFVRTAGINRAVLDVQSGEPIRFTGLGLTTGHSEIAIALRVDPARGLQPGRYELRFTCLPPDPTLELLLDPPPGPTSRLTTEVHDPKVRPRVMVARRAIDFLARLANPTGIPNEGRAGR